MAALPPPLHPVHTIKYKTHYSFVLQIFLTQKRWVQIPNQILIMMLLQWDRREGKHKADAHKPGGQQEGGCMYKQQLQQQPQW